MFAHELGHAIQDLCDFREHHFLQRLYTLSDEHFAFLVSAYLCSKETLEQVHAIVRFVGYPSALLRNRKVTVELESGYALISRD